MDLLLLHLVLLLWINAGTALRLHAATSERALVGLLLTWGNLTLTARLAPAPDWLDPRLSGPCISLSLAAAGYLLCAGLPRPSPPAAERSAAPDWLSFTIAFALAAAASGTFAAIVSYADSTAGSGEPTLSQFTSPSAALTAATLVPLTAWGTIGVALHCLCRLGGTSSAGAMLAPGFALLSLPLLATAACTSAALAFLAGLLAAVVFLMNSRQYRRGRDYALALLALGLTMYAATDFLASLQLPPDLPSEPWMMLLWRVPPPLMRLDEITAGLGTEVWLAALGGLFFFHVWRSAAAPTRWLATAGGAVLGLGLVASILWPVRLGAALLPGLLLAAPACVYGLEHTAGTHRRSRLLVQVGVVVSLLLVVRSAQIYLLHNTTRPLEPLLDSRAARPLGPESSAFQPVEPAPAPRRLFAADLLASSAPTQIYVDTGLTPREGPYSHWRLPPVRWQKTESVTLAIHAPPGTAKLRVSLSARLQVRRYGILELTGNDSPPQRHELDQPQTWHELVYEFPARPGENHLILRDAPLPPVPDWADYLDRYRDVKRYVESQHQPLFAGAREHYTYSGKAEGRTLHFQVQPPTAAAAHRFLYRQLRVEAFAP